MVESSDPQTTALKKLIAAVLSGENVDPHEGQVLDFKEDPSRRGLGGALQNGEPKSEALAKTVADAVACFANADGGTVVVGVNDKDTGVPAFIGTNCDTAWLQNRIRQLVSLEVRVNEHTVANNRIVSVTVDPSSVPICDTANRFRRRQGRDCEAMSAMELGQFSVDRQHADWSAAVSASNLEDIDPGAMRQLREWLRQSSETTRVELADIDDRALLQQLGLMSAGRLNRAGELLCVRLSGRGPLIDFMYRPAPGANTALRIDPIEAPLALVLADVELAIGARNPVYLLPDGLIVGQMRALPELALRESLMNAVAHRDWSAPGPIRVELEGSTLTVTNPGGLLPGVTPETVITASPRTRNPQLARALRGLRLAEAEGSGVDRMYRETLRQGLATPAIDLMPDGYGVICVLLGGEPEMDVVGVVANLKHPAGQDIDVLLLMHTLITAASVNATRLAPVIQKTQLQAVAALDRAVAAGLVVQSNRSGHYRFADGVRNALAKKLPYMRRTEDEHAKVIIDLLTAHGELRARDIIDVCGITQVHASRVLRQAVESGLVERHGGTGAGVFYTTR
jgi:ATP-dependent DNA helicase RecG